MNSRDFWNQYLQTYDVLTHLDDYAEMLQEISKRVTDRPGLRILDAGSGTGNLSVLLKNCGAHVCSLDFSSVALAKHREKDPSAWLMQASLEAPLPLEDNSFDVVVCMSVLFSLSEEGQNLALSEFRRILKPGGRLFVTFIKSNTSKLAMLGRHIRRRFKALRWTIFLKEFAQLWLPIVRIMRFNSQIRQLAREGRYRRLNVDAVRDQITKSRFDRVAVGSTYGNRFHLLEAVING